MTTQRDPAAGDRLAHFLDTRIQKAGLGTRAELAKLAGVNRSSIQDWTAGKRPPTLLKGEAVARVLGVRYCDLVDAWSGAEVEPDGATLIRALEWALDQLRAGETVGTGDVPPGVAPKAVGERRKSSRRPSHGHAHGGNEGRSSGRQGRPGPTA